jgi:hypothetical protein
MPRWATTAAAGGPGDLAPGIIGSSGSGNGPPERPARMFVSIRWTPAASTAIRTCPSPGSGSGTSS